MATRLLAAMRLGRIKSKLIVFAVLVALLPSLAMGWLSYRNNSVAATRQVGQELAGAASHASRALDLWLRDRQGELRVFANSYEVSENLAEISARAPGSVAGKVAQQRLVEYLALVAPRVDDYEALMVLDPGGEVVAASEPGAVPAGLTDGWVEDDPPIVGEPFRDPASGGTAAVIAEPVRTPFQQRIGFVAARVRLHGFDALMRSSVRGSHRVTLRVVLPDGLVLASSRERLDGEPFVLPASTARRLFADQAAQSYRGADGTRVVGAVERMESVGWGVLAEVSETGAYGSLRRLRNDTMVLTLAIVLAVGLGAYLLGLTIVRPLLRLTRGASLVAAGDLDVEVPVVGAGEVVSLTRTFNQMVAGLRQARAELAATNEELRVKNRELHELSITDGLTGLFNRGYLARILESELDRSRRHEHPFAVLMVDIDRFKSFNDTHGHLAGDRVLRETALVLKQSVRNCDYVARFGGEEFLLLLTETASDEARQAAERVRDGVEGHFDNRPEDQRITVSVGVAGFPFNGDESDAIVHAADQALYVAKRGGRNRIAVAPASRNGRQTA